MSLMNPFLLKLAGFKIGQGNKIYSPIIFHNTKRKNLIINNNCHIGRDVFFDLWAPVIIGNNVTISMRTTFITHMYTGNSYLKEVGYEDKSAPIYLLDGAYIGANTVILPGVTIGKNTIVAAGSVVNKNVSDNTLVGGVPAKKIKTLS